MKIFYGGAYGSISPVLITSCFHICFHSHLNNSGLALKLSTVAIVERFAYTIYPHSRLDGTKSWAGNWVVIIISGFISDT